MESIFMGPEAADREDTIIPTLKCQLRLAHSSTRDGSFPVLPLRLALATLGLLSQSK